MSCKCWVGGGAGESILGKGRSINRQKNIRCSSVLWELQVWCVWRDEYGEVVGLIKCFVHHLKVLNLYAEGNGELLRVFKQESGMKRFVYELEPSGSSVEGGLERGWAWWRKTN